MPHPPFAQERISDILIYRMFIGAPEEIRTPDPQIRSLVVLAPERYAKLSSVRPFPATGWSGIAAAPYAEFGPAMKLRNR